MTYAISDKRVSSLTDFTWDKSMPAKSIDPLRKVTIDLFALDVDWLKHNCENFSEEVRSLVRNHVTMLKAAKHRRTLGDLHHDGE